MVLNCQSTYNLLSEISRFFFVRLVASYFYLLFLSLIFYLLFISLISIQFLCFNLLQDCCLRRTLPDSRLACLLLKNLLDGTHPS